MEKFRPGRYDPLLVSYNSTKKTFDVQRSSTTTLSVRNRLTVQIRIFSAENLNLILFQLLCQQTFE